MTDSPNEKKFMREKIVKQKESKSQMAGRFFCFVVCAVILGIVAAVSFVVSVPVAKKYLVRETETPTVPITIEKDADPSSTTAPMETMEPTAPETPAATTEACADEEDIRQIVKEELKQDTWTADKVKAINQVLTEIGTGADQSIVTVSSVKHQKDWFDNSVESTGQYAGVIIAVNSGEIVVLTGEDAVETADSLRIVFADGNVAAGTVKEKDTVAGMAAISVSPAELTDETLDVIKAIELGNSYAVKTGDLIIAVGSPAGRVHSMKHGTVTYVAKNVQTVDGQTRVLYTDIACSEEKGTFFLNLNGQLVGWTTKLYQSEDSTCETLAMPISEYKGILQKLSNGVEVPYMGIMGQEVTETMQEAGIPKGIYITESIADGPAYLAGIQNGDILTKIQGEEVQTLRDFQNRLETLMSGVEVTVTIERKGIDAYKEIEYRVTIGAR